MKVNFSYLNRQFTPEFVDRIYSDIRSLVKSGDFTLGKKLEEFEAKIAKLSGVRHAIGVNSGTDALILSLKILGIGAGDEVITSAETFIASAGAIAAVGAKPVFVDVNDEFVIDADLIEEKITRRTKAIMPVWFTGNAPNMKIVLKTAEKHNLSVIEDSCCALDADILGQKAGSFGITGAFSFHPLKCLNVWGDAGMITTSSDEIYHKLSLYRNHGLASRDEVEFFGVNCRMDTLQAVIALSMVDEVKKINDQRIRNAQKLDQAFSKLPDFIDLPRRHQPVRHIFHLYMVRVKKRDELLSYCKERGIDVKVHYPIPLPYQKCCSELHYKRGDFPKTERDTASIITFPCHQHLTDEEINYMIDAVNKFYSL